MSLAEQSTKAGPMPKDPPRVLETPEFTDNPESLKAEGQERLSYFRNRFEEIATQELSDVSFASSLGALDDLEFLESAFIQKVHLLANTHPDEELRQAAHEIFAEYRNYAVEKAFDERAYLAIKAYSEKSEELEGADKKLLEDSLRAYRRIGMDLDIEKRAKLKELRKTLSQKETDFSRNINEYHDEIWVKPERLKGLEPSFVESLQSNEKGERRISLDYPEYLPVMELAEDEELRRELMTKKYRSAEDTNSKLLDEMLELRFKIATLLGYDSWNHYIIEDRMAKSPDQVLSFLKDLQSRLKPKGEQEQKQLGKLKSELTGDSNAKMELWDYYFLSSAQKKRLHKVDSQELKNYFELNRVLEGMFKTFQSLFGIQMKELQVEKSKVWHEEVRLFQVIDEERGPIAHFFLDLHPRPGKYGHAACFGLSPGKLLPDGRYQGPISAMVCNFPRPRQNQPALIPHNEVETLFHEFGHVLHGVLTEAKFQSFSGTSVALDFVEAPSQVLENWVWSMESLEHFARHYEDPEKKLSPETLERMKAAKKEGSALFYLRQISLALADLELHKGKPQGRAVEVCNRVLKENFLSPPANTSFAASWGHMVGYASGYYGYAWADVMAADLFEQFNGPGVMDAETGRRLRKEIYEPGSSREESESLESFLGRSLSNNAFFKDLGVA